MIPSINPPGDRTIGLLAFLYGTGKREQHLDPHLVASFDGMTPDPGRDPNAMLKGLQQRLDQPAQALPKRARPTKPRLTQPRTYRAWRPDLVRRGVGGGVPRIVAATGINVGEGWLGSRWAAVRHADDHIRIAATLVCEDGRRPDGFRSGKCTQAEARRIEKEFDFHQVAADDGTAAEHLRLSPTEAPQVTALFCRKSCETGMPLDRASGTPQTESTKSGAKPQASTTAGANAGYEASPCWKRRQCAKRLIPAPAWCAPPPPEIR